MWFLPLQLLQRFLHQILFVVPWTTREPSVARRQVKKKKLEETDMNSNSQCISKLPIKRRTCKFIILYVDDSLRLCRQAVPELNRFRRWSANRKAVGKQEALEPTTQEIEEYHGQSSWQWRNNVRLFRPVRQTSLNRAKWLAVTGRHPANRWTHYPWLNFPENTIHWYPFSW